MNPNEIKRQFAQAIQVLDQDGKLDKVTVCHVAAEERPDELVVTVRLPTVSPEQRAAAKRR